jgi:hypothetical protein
MAEEVGVPLDAVAEHAPPLETLLSADAILTADDIEYENKYIPAWGGWVRIKGLSGSERDEFEDFIIVTKGQGKKMTREARMANARAKLCSLAIVNKDDVRLFGPHAIGALGAKSAKALQTCFEIAMRLAGMTEEEIDDLGNDSAPDQSGSSTSA